MDYYRDVFGGTLEVSTYENSTLEVPEDQLENIMHATLTSGKTVIMASDAMPGQEVIHGNAVHLSIAVPQQDEAESNFTSLADGGTVSMPFGEVFWGGKLGMVQDRFGVNWMVSSA